jgi:hypothetical protein
METVEGGESPPKPKAKRVPNQRMVNVYNGSMYGKKIYLGDGRKILPGQTGKVPKGVYDKIKHLGYVKKAERGDV